MVLLCFSDQRSVGLRPTPKTRAEAAFVRRSEKRSRNIGRHRGGRFRKVSISVSDICWNMSGLNSVVEYSGRLQKVKGGFEKQREAPRSSEGFRKATRCFEKLREAPRRSEKLREVLRGSERFREGAHRKPIGSSWEAREIHLVQFRLRQMDILVE